MRFKIIKKFIKSLKELPVKACYNFLGATIWTLVLVLFFTFLTLMYANFLINKEIKTSTATKFDEKKFEELLKIFKEKGKINP